MDVSGFPGRVGGCDLPVDESRTGIKDRVRGRGGMVEETV